MQDRKMCYQNAWVENAGPENAILEMQDWKM